MERCIINSHPFGSLVIYVWTIIVTFFTRFLSLLLFRTLFVVDGAPMEMLILVVAMVLKGVVR